MKWYYVIIHSFWNCKWKNNNKNSNVYTFAMSYESPYHNFVSFGRCKKKERINNKIFHRNGNKYFCSPMYWYSMVDIVRILLISFLNVNVETFIFDDIKKCVDLSWSTVHNENPRNWTEVERHDTISYSSKATVLVTFCWLLLLTE